MLPGLIGIVKRNRPERSGGRMPLVEKGVRKGRQPFAPLKHAVTPERDERSGSEPDISYATGNPMSTQ